MLPHASHVELEEAAVASRMVYAKKLGLCLGYIAVSAILIRFNKWMMQKDHFPHSLALSGFHMLVTTTMCSLAYMVIPSMFPSMASTRENRAELMKWFIPIGSCFAVMLFGSNQAYMYCSVTFLQFMKEGNVMLVFLISCALGLQRINRLRFAVIIWVIIGSTLAVSGEMHFSTLGCAYQAISQIAECTRMVMGEIILSGKKLDPLTYTYFLAPICLVVLAFATAVQWNSTILPDFIKWWPLLFVNALVAFVLNVLVASVIKECSAVGFVLTGLTKDIAIVVCSCIFFGEPVTRQQAGAFGVTLAGVGFWSYMKVRPRAALVQAAEQALCMPQDIPSEHSMLLDKKV